MYHAREISNLTATSRVLVDDGIVIVPEVYSLSDIAEINAAMNPVFKSKEGEKRAYIRPDEMLKIGIFDKILSPAMIDLLLSIMPDPVLYHLHAYEIAGNSNQSHIFADQLGGWHRDPDSSYFENDPTHISVFVYLTHVGEGDGAFELSPQKPNRELRPDSPAVIMTGPPGLSFAWHRSFYHRASPNRGVRRRRLIKISVQRNEFPSVHLKSDFFRSAIEQTPTGDPAMDILLGRFQGKKAPQLAPSTTIRPERVEAAKSIDLPDDILKGLRAKERAAIGQAVAYD